MKRLWLVPLTLASCTPVATPPSSPTAEEVNPSRLPQDTSGSLPPAGYGSLRQDEFSVEIDAGDVRVKVTPLAEGVIRLAAPDTYERLTALASSRRREAERLAQTDRPALFLVSFFSRQPNAEYRPEELQLSHRGRLQRPLAIVPLTTGWGRQLLQPQQTQSAIYAFEPPFDYELPLTLRYGLRQSDDWHQTVLPRLEEERTRVLSRSAGAANGQR